MIKQRIRRIMHRDMNASQKLLLAYLTVHDGVWNAGLSELSESIGLSVRSVRQHIGELESLGFLTTRQTNHAHRKTVKLKTGS